MKRKTSKKEDKEKNLSLSGHLKELRNRVAVCVIVLIAAMLTGLNFAPGLVGLLLELGEPYGYTFVYLAPQELLIQYFSLSLILAVCVTLPVILYEVWAFIQPGLKKNENVLFLFALGFGTICLGLGVFFAYKVMLPFMLRFLYELSAGSGVEATISVQNYISFLSTIFLIFGIVFELPMLSVILTSLGFLKPQWMRKSRRIVIVVIFVLSALITPPDIVSQIMVAIPIMILYEFSIMLSTLCIRVKKKRKQEE